MDKVKHLSFGRCFSYAPKYKLRVKKLTNMQFLRVSRKFDTQKQGESII